MKDLEKAFNRLNKTSIFFKNIFSFLYFSILYKKYFTLFYVIEKGHICNLLYQKRKKPTNGVPDYAWYFLSTTSSHSFTLYLDAFCSPKQPRETLR